MIILVLVQAMISLLCCSLEVAAAGILTARKQFKFLVGAMVLVLSIMAVYCQAVRAYNWGLPGVWWGEHDSMPMPVKVLALLGCYATSKSLHMPSTWLHKQEVSTSSIAHRHCHQAKSNLETYYQCSIFSSCSVHTKKGPH